MRVNDVSRIVGHGDVETTLTNYGNTSKEVVAERTRELMRGTVLETGTVRKAITYEDFLKGVFGRRSKPEWVALTKLFTEIVTGRSTLVSDLSKPLRENASRAEAKRVQELVSGWLSRYDAQFQTARK